MTKHLDYYRAAQLLIQKFGDAAEQEALRKMNSFMDEEDVAAASAWLIIAQTIRELLDMQPKTIH